MVFTVEVRAGMVLERERALQETGNGNGQCATPWTFSHLERLFRGSMAIAGGQYGRCATWPWIGYL